MIPFILFGGGKGGSNGPGAVCLAYNCWKILHKKIKKNYTI
jgi:hypothetical protein